MSNTKLWDPIEIKTDARAPPLLRPRSTKSQRPNYVFQYSPFNTESHMFCALICAVLVFVHSGTPACLSLSLVCIFTTTPHVCLVCRVPFPWSIRSNTGGYYEAMEQILGEWLRSATPVRSSSEVIHAFCAQQPTMHRNQHTHVRSSHVS